MAAHDQGAIVKFEVGPFLMPYSLPASIFQSLHPLPPFLAPHQTGLIKCPEMDGQVWQMFVSWAYTRDYEVLRPEPAPVPAVVASRITRVPQSLHVIAADLRKPASRLCPDCFGLLRVMDNGLHLCDYCKTRQTQLLRCREADCLQINSPVACFQCEKLDIPRVGTLPRQAKKILSFAMGGWDFPGLPQHLKIIKPTSEPETIAPSRPWCHARRLEVQFQLYFFARTHEVNELQQLVRFKVWRTLMDLQPHPQTNTSMLMSLMTAISKLPPNDRMRHLLTKYWACVREDMRLTAPGFEQLGSKSKVTERRQELDSLERILAGDSD